jgi:predicted small lipoprotein YifL
MNAPRRALDGLLLVALVMALALSACGRKNSPVPPPGVPDTYPRPYPSE